MEINFNKIFYFFIGRWWIFCNQGENKYLQVCNYYEYYICWIGFIIRINTIGNSNVKCINTPNEISSSAFSIITTIYFRDYIIHQIIVYLENLPP